MTLPDAGHWLNVLRSLHAGLRRLVAFGWVLLVLTLADWGFQTERMGEEARVLNSLFEEVSFQDNELTRESKSILERTPGVPARDIPLSALPRALEEGSRRIDDLLPQRVNRLAGFELPLPFYRIAMIVAPAVLLAVVLTRVRRVRKLRRMLLGAARDGGDVQQVLNSPFYERITETAGEERSRHTFGVLLVLAHIPLMAFMYVPAVVALARRNFTVRVDVLGGMSLLSPVPEPNFTGEVIFMWAGILALSVATWIVTALQATGGMDAPTAPGAAGGKKKEAAVV